MIQEAYSQLLKSENAPDAVHNGEGGSSADVIKAIYGNKARIVYGICSKGGIDFVAKKAISKPATFSTTDEEGGQLVNDHAYTIHSSNGSHLELRNPGGARRRQAARTSTISATASWNYPSLRRGNNVTACGMSISSPQRKLYPPLFLRRQFLLGSSKCS